ncbi:PucR family transcriptional regulator [Sporosarcina siberiensis]|uniref:PucR family transcriptional regulator n=1 Tax=Sporosarcina siberiensis TaxID=1365606 RepID=A0ABW4SF16_9BACL
MFLSIKDIMELELLANATIKAGKEIITDKVVEWISVIESPVENFVRENELVLTTGIGCFKDSEELMGFVHDVYESGASALAFATGRYIFEIPGEIIHYAEERSFPIIDIPWEVRFADIIHEVLFKLKDLKKDEMKRSEKAQQLLIQMIIQGKTLEQITAYIEKELGKPVIIRNRLGEVVAGTNISPDIFKVLNEVNTEIEIQQSHHPIHSEIKKIESATHQYLHFAIQSNGNYDGDFFIQLKFEENLTEQDIVIVEQAVVATALWFSRTSAVMEAESRMQNEYILRLAKESEMTDEYVESHAAFFGFNLSLPYVCIVGHPQNLSDLIEHKKNVNDSAKTHLKQISIYVREGFTYAGENVQREILIGIDTNEVILFLEVDEDSKQETVNQYLDLVERRFSHLLPGATFSWGIGRHKTGLKDFNKSYQKAKSALDMGMKQRGIGLRIHFEETKFNRLLLNLSLNKEVREIVTSTISPIVKYDFNRDMELVKTITAYTRNNGNISQTARDLNLHRQSLLYRLRKIESLTDLSLVDPDDYFLMDFSAKIWTAGILEE